MTQQSNQQECDVAGILSKAAKSALFSWKQSEDGHEDLVNDLWVWYLERPGTQKKFAQSDEYLSRRLAYLAAMQILTGQALSGDVFDGKTLYSSDSVKEALKGESKNLYLIDILPIAFDALDAQNPERAEAIRSRYTDGAVPVSQSKEQVQLSKAVKSLTEHVNIITVRSGVDAEGHAKQGPGSRGAVFPSSRRAKGYGHSDPTANTAIMLMDNPVDEDGNALREEYLQETPVKQFLEGKGRE